VQQRAGLKRLFKFVLSGQVDEVLLANSTQLCNTKEGFELMEWACELLGARVRVVPSLDVF
jgi:predicted site-specific integrase-resolvase